MSEFLLWQILRPWFSIRSVYMSLMAGQTMAAEVLQRVPLSTLFARIIVPMTAPELSSDVIVVGAGPVGLTLAMVLAQRGCTVTVLEQRHVGEPPQAKCNHVAARSMEIFRRLGIVDAVRNAGLPSDYPNDISFRTTFTGLELGRIPIPARRDRYTATGGPDTDWPTPEPPHRINQIYLEPVLFRCATMFPRIRVLNDTQYQSVVDDGKSVEVRASKLDTGQALRLRARYVVGCDGGSSLVRHQIGGTFSGDPVVLQVQSTFICAPELMKLQHVEPAWGVMVFNERRCGTVYAVDGKEKWIVHNYLGAEETDFDNIDRDQYMRTILGVDADFSYDVLNKEDWTGRRLIADKFRAGRIFLCGDATHIWVPFAGYGMNAGIADAENLGWLMAAVLRGWAHEDILDTYEDERLPITEQVSLYAMGHSDATRKQRLTVPSEFESDTAQAAALRRTFGQRAYELNVQQYCCAGLNFGYFYDRSPIIDYDGSAAPTYTMGGFSPSTVPGCRLPHFFLQDGRSVYDVIGSGYALLRLDNTVDIDPFVRAFEQCGVPLRVVESSREEAGTAYTEGLVLARPDCQVAWRGDAAPKDVGALVDRVSGRARGDHHTAARAAG